LADAGARLAIRLLQEAAERGEVDPWDVDVIAVIDGFLDQLRSRIATPVLVRSVGGSYEHDLAETSEAFLAASVLVSLKADVLEAATFPAPAPLDEGEAFDFDADGQGWLMNPGVSLPSRPERHLWRRPVAPPPLQRPVTLGELIRQLEDIAERLEHEEQRSRSRHRPKRYSERAAIALVGWLELQWEAGLAVQQAAQRAADGLAASSGAGRALKALRTPRLLWVLAALGMALFIWAVVLTASRTGLVGVALLALWALADRRLSRPARGLLLATPLLYAAAWWGMAWWAQASGLSLGSTPRRARRASTPSLPCVRNSRCASGINC
jgi:hypothetical protein